jgi:hypothetical protein
MTSNQFKFTKFVVNSVISSSVASTAREIIRNNVENKGIVDSIQVRITTWVVGGVVFDYFWDRYDAKFNRFAEWVSNVQEEAEEKAKEEDIAPRDDDIIVGEIMQDNGTSSEEERE